jgi:diaminopimelate epimerase
MNGIDFIKMHGLGNDFVVIDGRGRPIRLEPHAVRAIADRHTGVGCDQVVVLARPETGLADIAMRIFNADGGEVASCGNASRCVAALTMEELDRDHVVVETKAALLDAEQGPDGTVSVDMGLARFEWRDIPLSEPADTLHLAIAAGPLNDPVAVSVGNPHAVFFVDDAEALELASLGPRLEHHPIFPERANIEVAQILGDERIRVRVWERGAGLTRACGTGACAALVAASRRGLAGRKAEVLLDGGALMVEWLKNDHVLMTGPVAVSFTGRLHESLLA